MKCPRCGAEAPPDAWNCGTCRINLYWATQHYEGLAGIREEQGLPAVTSSPPFLIDAHKGAMDARAARGGQVDNSVRAAARKRMRRAQALPDTADP